MATKLTSWQQIQNAVLQPTAKAMLYNVALATKKHLKEEIKESIYDSYSPSSYKRTKDFLNSVSIEKYTVYGGRFYQGRVIFDYKRIRPQEMEGKWNRHMDVHRDDFNKGNLVQVLEQGTVGTKSLFQRNGAWFIENTKRWLENRVKNNGFSVADVTMLASDPDSDEPPDRVPVGIRIRKRA